jgi:hypothetical protein
MQECERSLATPSSGNRFVSSFPGREARNVIERLPKPLHASICRALRQAWELDDADKAERLFAQSRPSLAGGILLLLA